ncbi:diguanylate cyclase [Vibrio algarum]|uniref:diguanylate cyclase n=1 Tax=Vibrio algarum TaxID=3020714 RepID=A0ABT4YM80_9VIBR|nr:diguanylate cyclase [Vibrio sp. KJ40-1]MDB1122651.1 diguanylate cyclase [Vibrio sp. KJ40-1]
MSTNQPIKLQSLVYRNFLRSSLIPLLVIELLLLALYFGINLYISDQNRTTLVSEVKQSLSEITTNEALRVNQHLEEVTRSARIMQLDHELFFNSKRCFLPNGKPKFGTHPNGVFYKINPVGASVYYSSTTNIGEQESAKAICSESLDPLLKAIVDTNPSITQAYINTWDDMNRLYPFMPDAPAQYGPVLEMENFNFYYDADLEHNPSRSNVWTEVYLDPAGQGWMLSNLVPIYSGNFLEGVSGLDVTVESFVENILNHQLPWDSAALVIDGKGTILAMQEKAEHLLGLQELKQHTYENNVTDTVTKPDQFNLFQLPSLPKKGIRSLSIANTTHEVRVNDINYIVDSKLIPETGWQIITFVNTKSFLTPISKLKSLSDKLGYLAVLVMFIFYVAFFMYLSWKSKRLALDIARPIEALTQATNKLGNNWDTKNLVESQVDEIQRLNRNFHNLFSELKTRTEELVESTISIRIQVKEKELLSKLAQTDSLTGIPNRLKLDRVLLESHRRAKNDQNTYGVLLLDIDYFKKVNDNYGHQIGDQVLTELSAILSEHVRDSDVVGRWGGEEFLVICTDADNDILLELAERLRKSIENNVFPECTSLTTSIGVAVYEYGDDIHNLLSRADKALYRAKSKGRNKVAC